MKTLYLMRHSETIFNEKLLLQGWCDAPLTKKGIKQAEIAKKYFEENEIKFDYIFCSSAPRAIHTLKIITDQEFQTNENLREWNFGLFEGESQKLIPIGYPYGDFFVEFNGESQDELQTRIVTEINEITKNLEGNILIVSHTCAGRLFTNYYQDSAKVEIPRRICNCGILKFEYENDKFNLVDVIQHNFEEILGN